MSPLQIFLGKGEKPAGIAKKQTYRRMTNLKAGLGLSERRDIFCADADHLQKRVQ
jgi:hypothetical protein